MDKTVRVQSDSDSDSDQLMLAAKCFHTNPRKRSNP